MLVGFLSGLRTPLFEGAGRPDLKLFAKPDKCDLILKTGMTPKAFRKDDAAIPIDREKLNVAIERDREFIPLIRIVWQASEKPVDLFRKSFPARIEGRSVERGVAIDAP